MFKAPSGCKALYSAEMEMFGCMMKKFTFIKQDIYDCSSCESYKSCTSGKKQKNKTVLSLEMCCMVSIFELKDSFVVIVSLLNTGGELVIF